MRTPLKPPLLNERVYIDRKTGKLTRQYFANGIVCPRVGLDSPLARRFAGYSLIQVDLFDAQAWLSEAFKLLPVPESAQFDASNKRLDKYVRSAEDAAIKLVKGLWFASLVMYGKCFTQAEGRRVKLERRDLPTDVRDYHDEIMTLRHTIVAHAGRTAHEGSELHLVLDPRPKRANFWLRSNLRRLDFADDRKDPVTFERLLHLAISFVSETLDELAVRINEREVLVHPIQHWYEVARRERS